MTPQERSESARKAAKARWAKKRQRDSKYLLLAEALPYKELIADWGENFVT